MVGGKGRARDRQARGRGDAPCEPRPAPPRPAAACMPSHPAALPSALPPCWDRGTPPRPQQAALGQGQTLRQAGPKQPGGGGARCLRRPLPTPAAASGSSQVAAAPQAAAPRCLGGLPGLSGARPPGPRGGQVPPQPSGVGQGGGAEVGPRSGAGSGCASFKTLGGSDRRQTAARPPVAVPTVPGATGEQRGAGSCKRKRAAACEPKLAPVNGSFSVVFSREPAW